MNARLSFFLLALWLVACKEPPIPIPPPVENPAEETGVVAVFRTNATGTLVLAQDPDSLPLVEPEGQGVRVEINPAQMFQEMDGFGAALTESSAYVLMEHLSAAQRAQILEELFSPDQGIGISFLRLTMGASDFSLSNYTYHDLPAGQTDPTLSSFQLGKEMDYVVPVLKEILTISPDLSIMASPWTAPAWMKSNQSMLNGGTLREEFYPAYADYFVKYLTAMAAGGISIRAITIQNEPLHQAGYPSMNMSAAEQTVFIRDHLGPALDQAGLNTKVVIYDHNWDRPDYPLEILADPAAKAYVDGTAFHCYGGDVAAMTEVRQAHPDRGIYFTECSGGAWSEDFGANLAWNMENLFVGAPRNWSRTVLLWNLALDEKHGPQNGGCADCRGVITVASGNGRISRNVEYYLLGHSSRFVRPGACRVESSATRGQGLSQVAYQNLDQSMVLVAYNHLDRAMEMEVLVDQDQAFRYTLEAGMLATFHWK